jgi:hypothetical protein
MPKSVVAHLNDAGSSVDGVRRQNVCVRNVTFLKLSSIPA